MEKHTFQADVKEVLSLVVNSLYTHKEVFLRELISNASDALDQLSFRALTERDLLGEDRELRIEILPDREARTLTVRDNGIGMTHDDLVRNLGTIAHSGTRRLVESLSGDQRKDLALIGQFGVGFYSAFLVADRVSVTSRAAGSAEAWKWESNAKGDFTMESAEREGRGTDVVLHLKAEEDGFLGEWALRDLVRKYSDFVRHPIRLEVEKETDGKKQRELEQVNRANAIWTRPKTEVTREQYVEFYRHLTHDWETPLAWAHFKVEGAQELSGLLFLPRSAPPDFLAQRRHGVRLFVRRVFIMEDCEELLPTWLRFVRGIVDSDDLPLNVSREFLQKDRVSAAIRKQVVRHVLGLLEELAAEGETTERDENAEDAGEKKIRRFDVFWRQFGRVLKEGVHEARQERDRIAKLLRWESSRGTELVSLADYVSRMPEGQPAVWYLTAETRAAAESSPHIEAVRKRGWEVLFMTDPVDEWVVEAMPEFEGKKLVSAAKGDVDLGETKEEKAKRDEEAGRFDTLLGKMREALGDRVGDVRLSSRLTDSPACLVLGEHGISPHVERLLRANRADVPVQKRVLELNPEHPAIRRLQTTAEDPARAERVADLSLLLYDQALVAEGSPPSDPARFARQIARLLEEVGG